MRLLNAEEWWVQEVINHRGKKTMQPGMPPGTTKRRGEFQRGSGRPLQRQASFSTVTTCGGEVHGRGLDEQFYFTKGVAKGTARIRDEPKWNQKRRRLVRAPRPSSHPIPTVFL